jgi:predicted metal-dependent hydrolase
MTELFDHGEFVGGLDLFNRAHFFDAHEVLEDVWRAAPDDRSLRRHLQGIVQLAVAFHHHSKGNFVGARSVLERGMQNLDGAERSFPSLDLDQLRAELAIWRRYLENCESASDVARQLSPPLPKIRHRC